MIELTRKQRVGIARRLREYARFLRNYNSYTELGEYDWDFPVFCTAHEVKVHVEDIVDEFEDEEDA